MSASRLALILLVIAPAAAVAQDAPAAAVNSRPDSRPDSRVALDADFWTAFDRESLRIRKANSLFACPTWDGQRFEASLDYPVSLPEPEAYPWLGIRVEADPQAYMRKVLDYVLEGNEEVSWRVQDNAVRKWFHAPWLTFNRNGREPIKGLTKERSSEPGELDAKQDTKFRNWAVAFYNAPGGYTLGKVWRNPRQPDTANVAFPVGTVTAKLLFTEATPDKVDLLNSPQALVWKAAVKGRGNGPKDGDVFAEVAEPGEVRLLQLDLAVRDERSLGRAGWIFGTYYFDAARPGSKWHEKLVLAGVAWGNDPELTHAAYQAGTRPKSGWIDAATRDRFAPMRRCGEMGLRGRINGPVDNPLSSCLSCHGRAMDVLPAGKNVAELLEHPKILGQTPAFQVPAEALGLTGEKGCAVDAAKAAAGEATVRHWYRDLGSSEPFEPGFHPLDYSLQLGDGVANFYAWALEFKKSWKPAEPSSRPADARVLCFPYCLSGFECITSFGRGECIDPAAASRPAQR